jgi:hypothetical protein
MFNIRPITDDDLPELEKPRASQAPAIKRIGARHHALAKMLAQGIGPGEAAARCGYAISRVSILQDDTLFKELVKHYRSLVEIAFVEVQEKLAGIASDALDELSERLENEPGEFANDELMSLVKMGADRTGNGPSSTVKQQVNISIASRLDAARDRLRTIRIDPDAEVIAAE